MYAIEFQSKIDNGVINIPEEYKDQVKQIAQAKIIILSEHISDKKKKAKFNAISINTKGFKFDREAANAL
ncbi:MAG: hypothetical protein FWC53_01785 [Firmicutes bacterium]|nr:hypothetical protein [Bacillota bacterium]